MDIKKEYKNFERGVKNRNAKYILILALILFVLAFLIKFITTLLVIGAVVVLVVGLYMLITKK